MKRYSAKELDARETRALALRKSADNELKVIERLRASQTKAHRGSGRYKKNEIERQSDLLATLINKKRKSPLR